MLLGEFKSQSRLDSTEMNGEMKSGGDFAPVCLRLNNSVFLQFVEKCLVFDLQGRSSPAPIPAVGLQSIKQEFRLGVARRFGKTIQTFNVALLFPFGTRLVDNYDLSIPGETAARGPIQTLQGSEKAIPDSEFPVPFNSSRISIAEFWYTIKRRITFSSSRSIAGPAIFEQNSLQLIIDDRRFTLL